jgi:hypothetical protein
MLRKTDDTSEPQTFDLKVLLFELADAARQELRRRGCPDPEGCAFQLATNFLYVHLPHASRCKIDGDKVTLTFPGAIDQKKVLFTFLFFAVRTFKRGCKFCKYVRHSTDEINPNDSQVLVPPQFIDPVTPENTAASNELFAALASSFANKQRLYAFVLRVFHQCSYNEIAELLDISPVTARMWVCRDRRRLRKVLTAFNPYGSFGPNTHPAK